MDVGRSSPQMGLNLNQLTENYKNIDISKLQIQQNLQLYYL